MGSRLLPHRFQLRRPNDVVPNHHEHGKSRDHRADISEQSNKHDNSAPALRPACDPNLWTLLIERQFNAAAGMLFRKMMPFGFSFVRGCLTISFQCAGPFSAPALPPNKATSGNQAAQP
jgi:hypothetical protein